FQLPSSPQTSTLSLHDALPISSAPPKDSKKPQGPGSGVFFRPFFLDRELQHHAVASMNEPLKAFRRILLVRCLLLLLLLGVILRSEEHTAELQSRQNLVCRLLH